MFSVTVSFVSSDVTTKSKGNVLVANWAKAEFSLGAIEMTTLFTSATMNSTTV